MKKLLNSAVFLIIISVICSLFVFTASATSATLSVNKTEFNPGDTVTVTVSLSGSMMTGADFEISYDSSVLSYVSGATQGGAGVLRIVDIDMEAITSKAYTVKFTALKSGNGSVSVSGLISDGLPAKDVKISDTRAVNVVDKALSDNAELKSLRPGAGTLSPKFSASKTEYTVTVGNDVTECKVYADTADANATVKVEGSATLKVGTNIRKVIVTAPSGAVKTYTLTIVRSEGEVSSDTPSSSELPSSSTDEPTSVENPLKPVIDGVSHDVLTDLSGITLFDGFSVSTDELNGNEVAVASDSANKYKLYYLRSEADGTCKPFIYNTKTDSFERLKYLSFNGKTYILAELPDNYSLPEQYYLTNCSLNGFDFKCFAANEAELDDFYYIYCYCDGRNAFYRYDTREETLQRYPELKLSIESSADKDKLASSAGLLERFGSLTGNAKIIVICLLVIMLCALALVVMLIIKLVHRDNGAYDDENIFDTENGFDTVTVEDGFSDEAETLSITEDNEETKE